MNPESKKIISVCGKGGVGKTAFSALLARGLLDLSVSPLLLIDADPAGGLFSALGEKPDKTLAGARDRLIATARSGKETEKERLASDLDYLVMEALVERPGASLLAMGRMEAKGCFCPANTLLREAIDVLSDPFALVLIDAEAGLEQISRQVTRSVTDVIVLSDGSVRSLETIRQIADMVAGARLLAVGNRVEPGANLELPENVALIGFMPEDEELRAFDKKARPLWDLPFENPARAAARAIAERILGEK
ncbi:MAG: AAA family ATPase [Thermodesulfobacteriota bacterium]